MRITINLFFGLILSFFCFSCNFSDNPITQSPESITTDGVDTDYTLILGVNQNTGEEQTLVAYETFQTTGYWTSSWRYFNTLDYPNYSNDGVNIYMSWTGGATTGDYGNFIIKRVSDGYEPINTYLQATNSYSGETSAYYIIDLQPNTEYKLQMKTVVIGNQDE